MIEATPQPMRSEDITSRSVDDPQPVAGNPLRWWVVAVVLAANVMDLMDATIVNVAGPSIRSALGGSTSILLWLSAGYTLAFAVFLITGARLGDMYGRRRLFLIGSAGFTLMSAACAAAPSPSVLIVFRVLQGAFGALMIPQGFGMIKECFAEDEMGKVFGAFGPMMGLSMVAAPILAGGLVEANLWGIGWRLVFLINVPIGIAAFAGAVRVLPRTVAHPGIRLDVGGMVLVGLALTAIIYPLIQGRSDGWPAWTFAMLGAGAVLLGAFALWERRFRGDPLIEPGAACQPHLHERHPRGARLLRGVRRAAAVRVPVRPARRALLTGPRRADPDRDGRRTDRRDGHGHGARRAARPPSAARRRRDRRRRNRRPGPDRDRRAHRLDPGPRPGLFLIGLGAGASMGQLFDFILAGVGMDEIGSASGVLEAVQQLSSAIGVAALGTIFFSAFAGHLPTHALAITAWACLAPVALAFALVFRLPMHAREPVA